MNGNPALSIPIGADENGLPIGVQIIGKKYHEYDILSLGKYAMDIIV